MVFLKVCWGSTHIDCCVEGAIGFAVNMFAIFTEQRLYLAAC